LFILAIDRKSKTWQIRKTELVYLILSLVAITVDHIYALFGHGVRSSFMSCMFLYPLLGGAVVYFMIERLSPRVVRAAGYRLFYNVYNSGIAILTAGSFLEGILEIAGTSSPFTMWFFLAGWIFIAAGVMLFLIKPLRSSNKYMY